MKRLLFLFFSIFLCFNLWSQTEPMKIFIRGTGLNRNAPRILTIGDQVIYKTFTRGLQLTIIDKTSQKILSDLCYDTYGNSTGSENLAVSLNSINNEQIGVLTSHDAWESSVTKSLDAAFYRLGLTIAGATINSGCRRPYAAIFEGASNGEKSCKVVEVSFSDSSNQPYAEIRGFLYQGSFIATGSQSNALMKPQGDAIGILVDGIGYVGIGTTTPQAKLDVAGTIRATEIKVEANGQTADFVFDSSYQLRDLQEVEAFIRENKHLPEIPRAKEMEANGVNLAEMNKLLLQKIEELTLYAIELENKVQKEKDERKMMRSDMEKAQSSALEALQDEAARREALEVRLNKLEELLTILNK